MEKQEAHQAERQLLSKLQLKISEGKAILSDPANLRLCLDDESVAAFL
jgi:hypothetical protein